MFSNWLLSLPNNTTYFPSLHSTMLHSLHSNTAHPGPGARAEAPQQHTRHSYRLHIQQLSSRGGPQTEQGQEGSADVGDRNHRPIQYNPGTEESSENWQNTIYFVVKPKNSSTHNIPGPCSVTMEANRIYLLSNFLRDLQRKLFPASLSQPSAAVARHLHLWFHKILLLLCEVLYSILPFFGFYYLISHVFK